ncbi:MAG: hypothetical protein LC748_05960 [Thermomicrobia bacterium]|nr:hypothetical protein [Thermomicrobia bacterium]
MDEQDMDVFEHDEDIDLDAEGAIPSRTRARRAQMDEARRRASERMDEAQRQAMAIPRKVVSQAVGALPVQTREHLRIRAARRRLPSRAASSSSARNRLR